MVEKKDLVWQQCDRKVRYQSGDIQYRKKGVILCGVEERYIIGCDKDVILRLDTKLRHKALRQQLPKQKHSSFMSKQQSQ